MIRLGEGVDKLKVGDRVAIECGVPCGECEFCLRGDYRACPDVVFKSTPPCTSYALCARVSHALTRSCRPWYASHLQAPRTRETDAARRHARSLHDASGQLVPQDAGQPHVGRGLAS